MPFPPIDHIVERLSCGVALALVVGADAGQRWMRMFAEDFVVDAEDGHLVGKDDAGLTGRLQDLDGTVVPGREDGGRTLKSTEKVRQARTVDFGVEIVGREDAAAPAMAF